MRPRGRRATRAERFWRGVQEHFFGDGAGDEAMEMDYDTFLRIGIEAGLIRETTYNPKRHGTTWRDDVGLAPGDPIYVLTPAGRRAAQGKE